MNDQYGRRIDYMRVSVTDRCNLRCVYCMPGEGFSFLPHEAACAAGNTGSCREVKGYSGYR